MTQKFCDTLCRRCRQDVPYYCDNLPSCNRRCHAIDMSLFHDIIGYDRSSGRQMLKEVHEDAAH